MTLNKVENLMALSHRAVQQAVEAGGLKRPDRCSECGQKKFVVAHHDDYSKPLVVRWLCIKCHKLHHKGEIPVGLKQIRLRTEIYDRLCEVKEKLPPKRSKEEFLNDAAGIGLAEMVKRKTNYITQNI